MAKKGGKGRLRRVFRGKGRRGPSKATRSLFQAEVGTSMGVLPFTVPDSGGYSTIDHIQGAFSSGFTDQAAISNIVPSFVNGLTSSIWDEAELALILVGEGYAAKKLGLRNATKVSKHWSIL